MKANAYGKSLDIKNKLWDNGPETWDALCSRAQQETGVLPTTTTILLIFILLSVLFCPVWAATITPHIGFFKNLSGEVYIIRDDTRQDINAGEQLFEEDSVLTGTDSTAGIVFQDGTLLTLGEQSELEIRKYSFNPHLQSICRVSTDNIRCSRT